MQTSMGTVWITDYVQVAAISPQGILQRLTIVMTTMLQFIQVRQSNRTISMMIVMAS